MFGARPRTALESLSAERGISFAVPEWDDLRGCGFPVQEWGKVLAGTFSLAKKGENWYKGGYGNRRAGRFGRYRPGNRKRRMLLWRKIRGRVDRMARTGVGPTICSFSLWWGGRCFFCCWRG